MATRVPAKKNAAYVFYVGLVSQANPLILQPNPTLAAGDVIVAIDDGEPAQIIDLPVVDADFQKRVKVSLSADEMNGDNITVFFNDAAGDEWCDLMVQIQTVAAQIDDIKAETANILTDTAEIGAAGAGLTALGDARLGNLDAAVSSRAPEAGGNVAAILEDTGTTVISVLSTLIDALPTAAEVKTALEADGSKLDHLWEMTEDDGGVRRLTENALEEAPIADVSALALEDGLEAHVLAVLNSYDPPTRAEATADKQAILDALGALNDITVGDLLAGDLGDDQVFAAGTLGDRLRKLFWVLVNRLAITDADGAFIAFKDDGLTPGATGTLTDDETTTERSAPVWP